MAKRILPVVRLPAFTLLFVLTVTAPIVGVNPFFRSMRSHR